MDTPGAPWRRDFDKACGCGESPVMTYHPLGCVLYASRYCTPRHNAIVRVVVQRGSEAGFSHVTADDIGLKGIHVSAKSQRPDTYLFHDTKGVLVIIEVTCGNDAWLDGAPPPRARQRVQDPAPPPHAPPLQPAQGGKRLGAVPGKFAKYAPLLASLKASHPGVSVRFGVLAVGTMGRLSVQMVHVARLLDISPASRNKFYREVLAPVYKAAEDIETDYRRSHYRQKGRERTTTQSGAAAAKTSAAKKQRGADTQRAAAERGTTVDGDYTRITTLGTHRMVRGEEGGAGGSHGPGPCSACPQQTPAVSCTWCGACFTCGRESPCPGQRAAQQTTEAELFVDHDVDKGFDVPGEDG